MAIAAKLNLFQIIITHNIEQHYPGDDNISFDVFRYSISYTQEVAQSLTLIKIKLFFLLPGVLLLLGKLGQHFTQVCVPF
ncbi:MAG: hypothetical protein MET45_22375 [Nostoc sp. LLA-1]|nr:hypothetical protein [Cyanocohniella sp. LLY]